VFASFDPDVEPLEDYLGPTILRYFDRVFDGRKLTILGYNRQRIPGNWKLMQENIKDPYHPGLLHTWFVTVRPVARRQSRGAQDGRAHAPRRDDLGARARGQGVRGHVGRVELQAER
jgi:phenylpropionate dioxygenase-like ring-hydroxylating dioxygenase large terminal subunit